jgi:hypothetical protein
MAFWTWPNNVMIEQELVRFSEATEMPVRFEYHSSVLMISGAARFRGNTADSPLRSLRLRRPTPRTQDRLQHQLFDLLRADGRRQEGVSLQLALNLGALAGGKYAPSLRLRTSTIAS